MSQLPLHDGKGGVLKSGSPSQVLANLCGGVVSGPANKLSIAGDPSGSQFGEELALFRTHCYQSVQPKVRSVTNPFTNQTPTFTVLNTALLHSAVAALLAMLLWKC